MKNIIHSIALWIAERFAPTPMQVGTPPIESKKPRGMKIAYSSCIAGTATEVKPYEPPPGVVPASDTQAVMAMDATPYDYANEVPMGGVFFAGYQILAALAQRPEHRVVVSTLAEEHTRKWIELKATGDEDKADKIKEIEDAMRRFRLREVFKDAMECDGFFGRGQVYIEVKTPSGEMASESDDLGRPLFLDAAKIPRGSLVAFRNVEPMWTYPWTFQSTNPLSKGYYKPDGWYVMGQKVHASRLMTIISRPVPDMLKPAYNFGGIPMSQMLDPYVNNFLRTRDSVSDLVHNFSTTILKTNMGAQLAGDAWDVIYERAKSFNELRDNKGLMMLDQDSEALEQINTPLSGLDALQAQSQEQIASISGIPLVKLLGTQPAGLNASSDGEIRVFYDKVGASQQDNLRPCIDRALKVIQLHLFGEIDPEITFEFVPLYQLTEKEAADLQKVKADTDAVYIQSNVIDGSEVRQRLASDPDSPYPGLDPDEVPEGDGMEMGGVEGMGMMPPQPVGAPASAAAPQ